VVVKNRGKGMVDFDKLADIVSDRRRVWCFNDVVVEHPHVANGNDDLGPCLKVADGLLSKGLIEFFSNPIKLIFKVVFVHGFTSFLPDDLSAPPKMMLLGAMVENIAYAFKGLSPDGDRYTVWRLCLFKRVFRQLDFSFGCDASVRLLLSSDSHPTHGFGPHEMVGDSKGGGMVQKVFYKQDLNFSLIWNQ
jgi:hypothetical protein